MEKKINKKIKENKEWKERDKEYLKELQNFLDKAENITDETLRNKVVRQMLRCDYVLTKMAENKFQEFYELGYENAKKE